MPVRRRLVVLQTTPRCLWSRVDVAALHRELLARIAEEQQAKRAYRIAVATRVAARVERARERLLAAHDATRRARAVEASARDALRRLEDGST